MRLKEEYESMDGVLVAKFKIEKFVEVNKRQPKNLDEMIDFIDRMDEQKFDWNAYERQYLIKNGKTPTDEDATKAVIRKPEVTKLKFPGQNKAKPAHQKFNAPAKPGAVKKFQLPKRFM